MKTISQDTNKIYFLLSVIAMIILTLAVFSDDPLVYGFFFNADLLYLPTLYESLINEGYHILTWHLNPSMLLIPDIALFFGIHAISGDPVISLFSFGIIQQLLIFLGIALVFRQLNKNQSWFLAASASLLMLLFFIGSILSRDFIPAAFGIGSTIHTGAFVMAVFCIALTLQYLNHPKKSTLILIFVLAVLSLISDRLFILMYAVPVLLVSGLMWIRFRDKSHLVLVVAVVIILAFGYWLHNFLVWKFFKLLNLPNLTDYSKIVPSFLLLMKHLGTYILRWNAHSLLIILSLISYISHFLVILQQYRNNALKTTFSYYMLFSAIFITGIFWMPVVTGNYTGIDILRYNIGAFYLALLNFPMLIAYYTFDKKFRYSAITITKIIFLAGLAGMLIIGISRISKSGLNTFFNYSPAYVKELDHIAEQEELLYGVANFWYAKPITVFSKKGLKVYHTFDQMVPHYHSTTRMWYLDESHVFNFAVLSSFKDKSIYRKYLDHEGRIVKYGNTEVLILPPFKFNQYTGLPYFIEDPNPNE
jgi:hypothetical protein